MSKATSFSIELPETAPQIFSAPVQQQELQRIYNALQILRQKIAPSTTTTTGQVTKIYFDHGEPGNSLGAIGDYYQDLSTGNWYAKIAPTPGSWDLVGAPTGTSATKIVQSNVQYSASLSEGQIVYIEGNVAYPVLPSLAQAVLGTLAVVLTSGSSSFVADMLLEGPVQSSSYSLGAGMVFLGTSGFPTSTDNPARNYVPLGSGLTANSFFFSPGERFFRS